MFWGGEKLKQNLGSLISGYTPARVDCAAYRLCVGPEVYVSPTGEPSDPRNKPKTRLSMGEGFTIPAGQFGFLLTEETVHVPLEAIAFISIRAKYKFRGLVNVSGFHVDPNFRGRLIFAVFNAGPNEVHLSRGEECFLIWYADLDQPLKFDEKQGPDSIPSDVTGYIAGGLDSFASLSAKIDENQKKLQDRITTVEREQAVIKWAAALIVGALITIGVKGCTLERPHDQPPSQSTSQAISPAPSQTTPQVLPPAAPQAVPVPAATTLGSAKAVHKEPHPAGAR